MRELDYKDSKGRWYRVALPEDVPDEDAKFGVTIGPANLAPAGYPEEVETRLHNELFYRKIFSYNDARRRRSEVLGALQAALAVDIEKIIALYKEE